MRRRFLILLALTLGVSAAGIAANLPINVHSAIVFNPASVTFPNQQTATPSGILIISISNIGNVGVVVGSLSITGTNAADFSKTSDCLQVLTPQSVCHVNVIFTPSSNGLRSAAVSLTASNPPAHTYSLPLSGTGVASGQTISAITLSPASFIGGAADGTIVGAVGVAISPGSPPFSGTLSLFDSPEFRLSSSTLPSNLLLNGARSSGIYPATIIAAQTGIIGSPFSQVLNINGTGSQSITSITLSPDNFTGGAGDGTVVGAISVGMTPPSTPFVGTLAITGADAARFRLSSAILPSNLLLNGTQSSGTYAINLVATQGGAEGSPFTQAETVTGGACPSCGAISLTGITLSNNTFVGDSVDGTVVGAITVQGSGNVTPTILSITGSDVAKFRLSSSTVPSNLLLNGTQPGGIYSINLIATLAGATGSPLTKGETITGSINVDTLALSSVNSTLYYPVPAALYPGGGSLVTPNGTWTFGGGVRPGGVDRIINLNGVSTGEYASRMQTDVMSLLLYAYSKDNDDYYLYNSGSWIDETTSAVSGQSRFGSLAGAPITSATVFSPSTYSVLTTDHSSLVAVTSTGTNTWNSTLVRDLVASDATSLLNIKYTAAP